LVESNSVKVTATVRTLLSIEVWSATAEGGSSAGGGTGGAAKKKKIKADIIKN
jgi:hypothetical protein